MVSRNHNQADKNACPGIGLHELCLKGESIIPQEFKIWFSKLVPEAPVSTNKNLQPVSSRPLGQWNDTSCSYDACSLFSEALLSLLPVEENHRIF